MNIAVLDSRNILPYWVLQYGLFFIYPMVSSSYYAFTDWNGLDSYKFIGFDNFTKEFRHLFTSIIKIQLAREKIGSVYQSLFDLEHISQPELVAEQIDKAAIDPSS